MCYSTAVRLDEADATVEKLSEEAEILSHTSAAFKEGIEELR